MPSVFNAEHAQGVLGPLKDKRIITLADLGSDDFEDFRGFILQAGSAGNIVYRTLRGATDITETGLAAGAIINGLWDPGALQGCAPDGYHRHVDRGGVSMMSNRWVWWWLSKATSVFTLPMQAEVPDPEGRFLWGTDVFKWGNDTFTWN